MSLPLNVLNGYVRARVKSTAPSGAIEAQVRAEQVNLIYGSTYPAVFGNILGAVLSWLVLAQNTPGAALDIWLGGIVSIALVRWTLYRTRERQKQAGTASTEVWESRLFAIMAVNGLGWACFGAIVFFLAPALEEGMSVIILGGMVAGAVGTLGPLRRVFLAHSVPIMASLITIEALHGDREHLIMALFAACFGITVFTTARHVSVIMRRNIELRLHNEGLVESLRASNHQLADTNEVLEHQIEERRQAESQIAFLATHDALTGLPNRRLQEDRFDQAVAQAARRRVRVALLFIDLDRFKEVNDSMGHPTGDELLETVAARLRDCLRDGDSVCRQGGDEFLLMLSTATHRNEVATVARRIIRTLREPAVVNGHVIKIGCSIGISLYPNDGTEFEVLVGRADEALYRAKRQGRANYRFFSSEIGDGNAGGGLRVAGGNPRLAVVRGSR